jgi:hypothetical protein
MDVNFTRWVTNLGRTETEHRRQRVLLWYEGILSRAIYSLSRLECYNLLTAKQTTQSDYVLRVIYHCITLLLCHRYPWALGPTPRSAITEDSGLNTKLKHNANIIHLSRWWGYHLVTAGGWIPRAAREYSLHSIHIGYGAPARWCGRNVKLTTQLH